MKTARLDDGELQIVDRPTPEPRYEEAVVRLTAAGVCHSDLHLMKGDWAGVPRSGPFGHEGVGVVEALGPGADRYVNIGDRVILGLGGSGGGYWCGACDHCLGGRPRLCSQSKGILGTYSEEMRVYAKSLVVLPDSVVDNEVPLACGGLTAYGAVKKLNQYGVVPGSAVAILGAAGGLGHYAVQIAKHWGYKVVGVDVGPERIEFVRSLGVDLAVDVNDAKEATRAAFPGGVHASLVFSPRLAGYGLGMDLLRRGGMFVAVGIPADSEGAFEISPWQLFGKDPLIMFSAVGTVQDMRELVQLAADGHVKTHVSRTGALSELPEILEELEAGAYTGRAVITDLAG
ncbi:MAG: propanol-preferring alcohol dehydrogenase [Acidimicrobiales bacterium]|jgi:alcohol dehydrogenase, propanol-preferring